MIKIKVGRRKTAVARVKMVAGTGKIVVNERAFENYFPIPFQRDNIVGPFKVTETEGKYDVSVNVFGGGISGQAEAVRLAISRTLVEIDPELRVKLKPEGYLTRDPRMVERKKYGQKKARKRFQFSKR